MVGLRANMPLQLTPAARAGPYSNAAVAAGATERQAFGPCKSGVTVLWKQGRPTMDVEVNPLVPLATCISVASYANALTYGQKYRVLAEKASVNRPMVRVQGDTGRMRWFPASCFDVTGTDVVRVQSVRIAEPITDPENDAVTVEVTLTDGQRRWCWFATPAAFVQSGDRLSGTRIQFHYDLAHFIIVTILTTESVVPIIHAIEQQGRLLACTMVIEPASPEESP